MKIFKTIAVAFSLYSRIPMPSFAWTEDDMKHNLVFLPWIGAVIGAVLWSIYRFIMPYIPPVCTIALILFVPLFITGGFHVDGFMDVQDALSSFRSREEKLKILKDPHIGAFAVIRLAMLGLIWLFSAGALVYSNNSHAMSLTCCIFALSRSFSGVFALSLKHAKKDGMLNMETGGSIGTDTVLLAVQAVGTAVLMLCIRFSDAIFALAGLAVFSLYYKSMCYKQFGGVTGDTSGYFTTVSETVMLLCISIAVLI